MIGQFIIGIIIGLVITLVFLPELSPQQSTEISVKVVEVDRDAGTVTLLCPMVHSVELVVEVESPDAYVLLREGEFLKGRLVPGQMNTTTRSMVVVKGEDWEGDGEELRIKRVVLK